MCDIFHKAHLKAFLMTVYLQQTHENCKSYIRINMKSEPFSVFFQTRNKEKTTMEKIFASSLRYIFEKFA
jgi:hypothetical protein